MKMGWTGYLAGFVLASILAIANARHLTDASIGWVLRYSSIAWTLMAAISLLNLIHSWKAARGQRERNGS